ncbi:phage tail sheath family protein [Thioalkalivibrio denitrificans]|nr:phage tail sheath family protein [Thioalkalivibrio denitrificans]
MHRKLSGHRSGTPRAPNRPGDTPYRTPGVYVESRPDRFPEIEPADLSAAAFVGITPRGPVGTAVAIEDMQAFTNTFGDVGSGHLGIAAGHFFANGGRRLYVVRICAPPETGDHTLALLTALDGLDDLGLLALPGVTATPVLSAAIRYCEARRHMITVADCPPARTSVAHVRAFADGLRGPVALYHPWLRGIHAPVPVPPSGAVSGVLARYQIEGCIWRSPAGPRAALADVTGVVHGYSRHELGELVRHNINPIRNLSGVVTPWGARTLSDNPEHRYLGVLRFLGFVEASIRRSTGWALFEPNDHTTWTRLRASVEAFLDDQWRAGALQGSWPEDAFFVRCDETTMTPADLDEGRLVILVGLAALRASEFLGLRIELKRDAGP